MLCTELLHISLVNLFAWTKQRHLALYVLYCRTVCTVRHWYSCFCLMQSFTLSGVYDWNCIVCIALTVYQPSVPSIPHAGRDAEAHSNKLAFESLLAELTPGQGKNFKITESRLFCIDNNTATKYFTSCSSSAVLLRLIQMWPLKKYGLIFLTA